MHDLCLRVEALKLTTAALRFDALARDGNHFRPRAEFAAKSSAEPARHVYVYQFASNYSIARQLEF